MRKQRGVVHAIAECKTCGREWQSKNSIGLAAQHTIKTGHDTVGEEGVAYWFYGESEDA